MAGRQRPQLILQPSVNTTTVVTTTTTTTTYAPIPLPALPPPLSPKDPKHYPLLHAPLPQSLRHFPLTFPGGARATFREGDNDEDEEEEEELASGRGWRMLRREEDEGNSTVVGLQEALERYGKKRAHDEENVMEGVEPTPRKKPRVPLNLSAAAPPSPLPSPHGSPPPLDVGESIWPSAPPSPPLQPAEQLQQAPFEADMSLTTLLALPSLLNHFAALPEPLQSHLLLTLLRHSSLPVLRTLHSVLTPTLARDFLTLLPPELVSHVLSYLPFSALARASRVSKAWRFIIDGDKVLWRDLLKSTRIWFGGESESAFAKAIYARRKRRPEPSPGLPLPHPYKILFKSRHLSRTRWISNPAPKHISFPAHGHSVVTCLLFSHGRIISASDDHSIHVYSPVTGRLEQNLEGHEGGVWALAASGTLLVSGSTDRTVRIWDLSTGRCLHVFGGHTSTVRCLAIVKPEWVDVHERDEQGALTGVVRKEKWPKRTIIVTGSRDHSLRVWTLPRKGEREFDSRWTGEEGERGSTGELREEGVNVDELGEGCDPSLNPYHLLHLNGHTHAVRALAARGRTLVSGSYDCTVRLWDTHTGACTHTLTGHTQKVYSVVLDLPRTQACSGSMDGTVRIWSTLTGECMHTLTGHTSLVGLLGLSENYLVSAAADSTLRVWDPRSGELKQVLAAHTGAITCFQHDEFKVLSGSDGTLKMWDLREGPGQGGVVRDLLTGITGVWQVAFEGRWCVSASNRSDVTVLDVWDFGRVEGGVGVVGDVDGQQGGGGMGLDGIEGGEGGGSGIVEFDEPSDEPGALMGEEDWVGEPPGGVYDEEWEDEEDGEEGDIEVEVEVDRIRGSVGPSLSGSGMDVEEDVDVDVRDEEVVDAMMDQDPDLDIELEIEAEENGVELNPSRSQSSHSVGPPASAASGCGSRQAHAHVHRTRSRRHHEPEEEDVVLFPVESEGTSNPSSRGSTARSEDGSGRLTRASAGRSRRSAGGSAGSGSGSRVGSRRGGEAEEVMGMGMDGVQSLSQSQSHGMRRERERAGGGGTSSRRRWI